MTRLLIVPRGFWEGEEIRFALALLTYDPFHQQPEAPGYPLFVGLTRLANFFIRDPFVVLMAFSFIASVVGAFLLARIGAILLGNAWVGMAAALILYLSPAMLVFSPLPNAEATAVALVIAAIYFYVTGKPILFAAVAAAAIGCRPQIALAMVVVFVIGWMTMPRRREAMAVFAFIVLVSFAGLVESVGVGRLREYIVMNVEAARIAHQAATFRELVMRFVAHPWGSKYLAFPLLIAAAVGVVESGRLARSRRASRPAANRDRAGRPLAAGGTPTLLGIHIVFCCLTGSLNDGVQPVLPALVVVAFFAAAAFVRLPIVGVIAALLYGAASFVYAWPLLLVRHEQSSPPMQAARYAVQQRAVVLPDPALQPHATIAGATVTNMGNFDTFVDQPETRLMLLVDGESHTPGARVFSWPDSDIYGKITTERYRVVSAVPVPPERRYAARIGVYPFESAPDRGEWRWLAKDAVIDLPPGFDRVTLRFALPNDAPIESNEVRVGDQTVTVARGGSGELTVAYSPRLVIRCARSFVGPDGRNLAVQLVRLECGGHAAALDRQ